MNQTAAMIAPREAAYLERYARDEYSGRGELVDLGCWMGATTLALARGLDANRQSAVAARKVQAFDRFIWEPWMDQFVADTPYKGRFQSGDSFAEVFLDQTAGWRHRIDLHAGDLLRLAWSGQPIEFLFIDAMKSWELAQAITRTFFPCLVPGLSTVVHQDFGHFGTYWIHLVMYRLRHFFEPIGDLEDAWSMVFRCRAAIPTQVCVEPLTLESFSHQELEQAFAYSATLVSADKQAQLVGAHALALLHTGRPAEASKLLERAIASGVSAADRKVPLGLLFGSILMDYFASVTPDSARTTPAGAAPAAPPPDDENSYTGERHIPGQAGLACADLFHMLRYAYAAPLVAGRRVLDIACGTGYGSQYLASQHARDVVGVDKDPVAIRYALRHYGAPTVRYLEGDAHSVSTLADASFDVIVSFETIEHVEHPLDFLRELQRLLKPTGVLLLSCPNDAATPAWGSPFHRRSFSFDEFRDLVTQVFGNARFLGQHHLLGSCLSEPTSPPGAATPMDAFLRPLPQNYFAAEYLCGLNRMKLAEGYLAVVGSDSTGGRRMAAFSQSGFRELMEGQAYLKAEAARGNELALAAHTAADLTQKKCEALQVELARVQRELAVERATLASRLNQMLARILRRK